MRILASIMMILAIHAAAATAWAQDKGTGDSDKLDIKKLEDKYWSAKDDDFNVVQNRTYTKEKRVAVTLLGGMSINDPYSSGNLTGLALSYHTSERFGYELTYLKTSYKDNEVTSRFVADHDTMPNHNVLKGLISAQVNFIPLYAKMSWLDKRIIYFDMGFGLGIGQTQYEQAVVDGNRSKTGTSYMLSVYQTFFFSEHFALKADFRNTWTSEERVRYKMNIGEPESARSIGSKSINDSQLLLGLTYFFGASGNGR